MAHALSYDQARAKGTAWLMEAQAGDGSWVDPSGSQSVATATADEALALSGISKGYVAGAATSWLLNAPNPSNDSLARTITALAREGQDVSVLVQQLLSARSVGQAIGTYSAWGAYPGYQATALDTALVFDAFIAAKHPEAGYTVSVLTELQHADGGWAYGDLVVAKSSLVPTAQVLRTLGNYVIYNSAAQSAANSAVSAGVAWLLAHKKNDGGFAEDADVNGSNDLTLPSQPMETALVWSALWTLQQAGFSAATAANATQAMNSAQALLLAQQRTDGSWNGDAMSTATVMRALATSTMTDSRNVGVPDAVQTVLTASFNVSDPRSLPKGNGDPVLAVVAAANAVDAGDVPTLPEWGVLLLGSLLILVTARVKRLITACTDF